MILRPDFPSERQLIRFLGKPELHTDLRMPGAQASSVPMWLWFGSEILTVRRIMLLWDGIWQRLYFSAGQKDCRAAGNCDKTGAVAAAEFGESKNLQRYGRSRQCLLSAERFVVFYSGRFGNSDVKCFAFDSH